MEKCSSKLGVRHSEIIYFLIGLAPSMEDIARRAGSLYYLVPANLPLLADTQDELTNASLYVLGMRTGRWSIPRTTSSMPYLCILVKLTNQIL
jgi:hypothetical protein